MTSQLQRLSIPERAALCVLRAVILVVVLGIVGAILNAVAMAILVWIPGLFPESLRVWVVLAELAGTWVGGLWLGAWMQPGARDTVRTRHRRS